MYFNCMTKINILTLLFINLLLVKSVSGQNTSNQVFTFLELPVSAKASAFNTHVVSQANPDLLSSIANPAYLDSSFSKNIQVAYYSHFADSYISSIAYSYHIASIGQLTTSIRYFNYGNFNRYDENGFEIGSFSSYDVALTTSVSKTISKNLNIGGSITLVRSAIEQFSSNGITFSFGSYYQIPEHLLSIGFSVRDIGVQLSSYNNINEPIPMDISLGLSKKLQYVPFRFTVTLHSLQNWDLQTIYDNTKPDFSTNLLRHIALGGEFLFTDSFHLRFGYNKFRADAIATDQRLDFSGTSFGAGIKISTYLIDVTRSSYSSIGSHYQLSISTRF